MTRIPSPASRLALVGLVAVLGACATVPSGPSMLVLPGAGRSFDQFRADDMECRRYAEYQVGGQAQDYAESSGVKSAAVGTAVGAVAGAAIGGSRGAAVGAGSGLLFGSAAGAGAGQQSAGSAQRRYDNAYIQCMYAKGHRVPVSGQLGGNYQQAPAAAAPMSSTRVPPPPPPPGNPPPPPSR